MDSYRQRKQGEQSVKIEREGVLPKFMLTDNNNKPSWQRFGKGTAALTVKGCNDTATGNVWIEVTASEVAHNDKRETERTAYVTAFGDHAVELYKMLREVFEPAATRELIELAERLTPSGEIGDGMVARFHELAKRAKGN